MSSARALPAMRRTLRRIASDDKLLGSVVVGVTGAVLVTTTVVYLHPPGRHPVIFETTDAASIRGGEDVRIAGVSVGKVTGVTLEPTAVRVRADVATNAFVGADSTIEVRMLTAVGGYYVSIVPLGEKPLGDTVIPTSRVTMPYSIADVLQDVPPVTDNTDGTPVHSDIAQLATGLQHSPDSVGSLVAGLDSIAKVMSAQRDQIRTTLSLASEYTTAFNSNRDFVFQFLRDLETVLATYNTYRAGFNESYQLLGDVLTRLLPEEQYFIDHKQDVRAAVAQAKQALGDFLGSVDPTIGGLSALRDRLAAWLTPDGIAQLGGGQLLASQVCVPVPGRAC
ncbi:MlaD family protein [Nocardia tengchongensis]|uniref:MlaD family protein n=1 Tax=Nocardia tengchongensis TaxID=2055889 RepID=UPI0036193547